MMRAMFLDFADDTNTYNLDQQYMFGHSLLVAPVMNEGETEKLFICLKVNGLILA